MLGQKRSALKTNASFWSQLEVDIDKYAQKAKKNIKAYEKIQYKCLFDKKPVKPKKEEKPLSTNLSFASLSEIREKTQQEKQKQTQIRNKLSYLKVEKNRRLQSSELAKKKYEKVLSIRSRSFKDKEFVKDEVSSYKKNNLQEQKSKANKVKSERWRIERSVENLREISRTQAIKVKNQSKENEKIIEDRRRVDLKGRKMRVHSAQIQLQRSRKKLQQLGRQKVQNGKKNYQKKMWDQYKTFQLQNRKNTGLLANFKKQVKKIEKEKEAANKSLKEYRQFLMIDKKRKKKEEKKKEEKKEKDPPSDKQKESKSFYITSY